MRESRASREPRLRQVRWAPRPLLVTQMVQPMMFRPWPVLLIVGALCSGLAAVEAAAQAPSAPPGKSQAAPKSQPKTQPAAPSGEGGGLAQRIQQLEEQIVDMQVVIGTLESLARGGGRPAAGGGGGGGLSPGEAGRLDSLETQIRAMTAQLEQLSDQVRALGGTGGGAPTGGPRPVPGKQGGVAPGGFGSTVVTPGGGDGDPIGKMIKSQGGNGGPVQASAAPPTSQYTNPRQLFEVAYGHLLQQEYGAAEAAFADFLQRFPNDPQAGSAQYWLGESHFVRGQYQNAARAFLKGYQAYRSHAKAPDSLLKLAMSLEMLGQRADACATFAELAVKFPQAPAHVKNRAQSERQRLQCP